MMFLLLWKLFIYHMMDNLAFEQSEVVVLFTAYQCRMFVDDSVKCLNYLTVCASIHFHNENFIG